MSHATPHLLERDVVSHACGQDLEYDADFLALQHAASGKPEQQFGSTIIPSEAPDWRQVERLASSLGERTVDIRVLVYRAQASAEQYGLAPYARLLDEMANALAQHWADIHPRLTVDGEEDPFPRINALAALNDSSGAARSVRDSVLIRNEYGVARLRDVEAILDTTRGAVAMDYPGGRTRLVDDLQKAYVLNDPSVTALPVALDALSRIRGTVMQHLGESWVPDFAGLERSLHTVVRALALPSVLADDAAAAPAGDPGPHADSQALDASAAVTPLATGGHAPARQIDIWRGAEIVTRADATAMLEKVSQYFEVHEPSHPAPMLIRRIQQLIPLGFYDIVKNLAPQGLGDVETFMPRPSSTDP